MKNIGFRRIFAVVLSVLMLVCALSACNNSAGDAQGSAPEQVKPGENLTDVTYPGTSTGERKIIYHVSLSMESKTYADSQEKLKALASSLGGYLEASRESEEQYEGGGRYASYVFRIPAESLDAYLSGTESICKVLSNDTTSEDISDTYYDAQARLDAYVAQETRLLELMKECTDLSQLLQMEDRLTEVRYSIEKYKTQLNGYDKSVYYATVTVSLSEVVEYSATDESFGEKIGEAFASGFGFFAEVARGLFLGFLYLLPWLLVAGVILAVVFISLHFSKKRKNRKKSGNRPE